MTRQATPKNPFLTKGRQVAVDGRIHYSRWRGEDGSNRDRLKVVGNVEFLGSRPEGQQQNSSEPVAS